MAIADDMAELCPNALLLNYVNPMAMNCWAISRATTIKTVGLCHSVQGTAEQLAHDIRTHRVVRRHECAAEVQAERLAAVEVDCCSLNTSGLHLRGDHPLPDQLVKPQLVGIEILPDRSRRALSGALRKNPR